MRMMGVVITRERITKDTSHLTFIALFIDELFDKLIAKIQQAL